ncbi:unnamed protein product [Diatraea saccharalis]|uniref:Uncharacterized protein n=1 Tax=Diatraea saccharalis TaxID=40085 RepID=A0A9P0CAJ4_9NEOP|nr:unnamed protein product [Diatraea saccharalis]
MIVMILFYLLSQIVCGFMANQKNFLIYLDGAVLWKILQKKTDFCVSDVEFLPFINAPSSDYNTIYTSLKVAAENSRNIGMQTCIVTFDQPLYYKSQEILHSSKDDALKNVVVRLGGFHMLMSFLGAIGFIMKESGIKELWSCVYATNSIDKMLMGHSYARAVRAHMLTNAALFKLMSDDIHLSLEEKIDIENAIDNKQIDVTCHAYQLLQNKLAEALTVFRTHGPTAQLWLQYFEMTTLMKKFIEAERSGNWNLHLETVKIMLPFFYSTGHFNYAKCISMYLDDMYNLQNVMPTEEYDRFTKGLFTIRRTDKFWSGVWSDMTIEQTLMRSMKSTGGLTRGRGVSENILSRWILSLPVVQKVSEKVEMYCKVEAKSCEQHMDSGRARIKRDRTDIAKLFQWLKTHDPFRITDKIVCISKGIVGHNEINCHKARDIGRDMMLAKVGCNYNDIRFSRKQRVITLQNMTASVKTSDGEKVAIDSDLIMRRILFSKQSQQELQTCFEFELTPYPLSLFDASGMRKTKKSSLYDLFESFQSIPNTNDKCYVIDGGYLLHKVIWQKGMSFRSICDRYVHYVTKTFGITSIVVFDGYGNIEMNIKNAERARRTQGKKFVEILFDENTTATVTQDSFLSNEKNKERLITMLKSRFEQAGINTYQSDDDADTLIVTTAIQKTASHETVLIVGEDVDLLVILMAYPNPNVYLMKPGRNKIPTKYYNTNSLLEPSVKEHILFLHAFSGCDTTSALYRIGKKKRFSILRKDIELKQLLKIFKDPEADASALTDTGEKFMCTLYGDPSKTLNILRYERFAQATLKSAFNMANLPPTADDAKHHTYRVYYQIQKWLNNYKDPTHWGWKIQGDMLTPVQKTLNAVPAHILQTISCRCKVSCCRNCTCKKCGMQCTDLCTYCVGRDCHGTLNNNNYNIDSSDDEDADEIITSETDDVFNEYVASERETLEEEEE